MTINLRAERLRNFCEERRDVPAVWGTDDCTMFAADWIERETGIALPRPVYATKEEAHAQIAQAGSLMAVWGAALPSSFRRTESPVAGDIGIVDTMGYGPVGVIWTRPAICAWRTLTGVRIWSPNPNYVLASWALPV
jgi:hypothetical protein